MFSQYFDFQIQDEAIGDYSTNEQFWLPFFLSFQNDENINDFSPEKLFGFNKENEKCNGKKKRKFDENNRRTTKNTKTRKNTNSKSKDRKDNKIIKIKTFVSNIFHNFINQLLKEKNKKLCKLNPKKFKETIKKDDNIELWDKTFKDIYLTTEISGYYRKLKWKKYNIKVINEIYNKENNGEIKQALDLTFGEVFQIFLNRDNLSNDLKQKTLDSKILDYQNFCGLDEFYEYIKKAFKEKSKSDEFINNYIYDSEDETGIEDLCYDIKNWFIRKKGRKRKK